jgi:hypothetical protein
VRSKFFQVFALLILVGATGWAHARIPNRVLADPGDDFVPAPRVLQTAALGFDAILADYYWLKAVQVVGGDGAVDAQTAGHLGRLIDVVTTLNPHVDHPYRFAAVWLTHTEEQVRFANTLLERAIAHHPDEWRNYFYLGFNHFFYLADFEAAASVLETGAPLPGAPTYLPRLVARLKSQQGDIDVAEVFLRQLLASATDEMEVARLEAALDEIEIEYKARVLDRAREAYQHLSGHDIESVADLVRSPWRVLAKLPNPEPDALPPSLSRGSIWEIDEQGRIVSSYLGARYEVHYADRQGALFAGDGPDGFEGEESGGSPANGGERGEG